MVARLAAFRNVWWSLANEFDFMKEKQESDWDRIFQVVQESDPYQHLRSIHNGTVLYNQTNPWVTHASIQNGSAVEDSGRAVLYRDVYRKPIVFDEVKYEGDIPQRWGNLSAEEMVHRFWQGTIAGTYVGHGETYLHPEDDILWWSKGGVLRGQSRPRIAFLREILEEGPPKASSRSTSGRTLAPPARRASTTSIYFGKEKPTEWTFEIPRTKLNERLRLRVDLIDTWAMTVTPLDGVFELGPKDDYRYRCEDTPRIELPGKPYMLLRLRRSQ